MRWRDILSKQRYLNDYNAEDTGIHVEEEAEPEKILKKGPFDPEEVRSFFYNQKFYIIELTFY